MLFGFWLDMVVPHGQWCDPIFHPRNLASSSEPWVDVFFYPRFSTNLDDCLFWEEKNDHHEIIQSSNQPSKKTNEPTTPSLPKHRGRSTAPCWACSRPVGPQCAAATRDLLGNSCCSWPSLPRRGAIFWDVWPLLESQAFLDVESCCISIPGVPARRTFQRNTSGTGTGGLCHQVQLDCWCVAKKLKRRKSWNWLEGIRTELADSVDSHEMNWNEWIEQKSRLLGLNERMHGWTLKLNWVELKWIDVQWVELPCTELYLLMWLWTDLNCLEPSWTEWLMDGWWTDE